MDRYIILLYINVEPFITFYLLFRIVVSGSRPLPATIPWRIQTAGWGSTQLTFSLKTWRCPNLPSLSWANCYITCNGLQRCPQWSCIIICQGMINNPSLNILTKIIVKCYLRLVFKMKKDGLFFQNSAVVMMQDWKDVLQD